jgi:hypothetical protein
MLSRAKQKPYKRLSHVSQLEKQQLLFNRRFELRAKLTD